MNSNWNNKLDVNILLDPSDNLQSWEEKSLRKEFIHVIVINV